MFKFKSACEGHHAAAFERSPGPSVLISIGKAPKRAEGVYRVAEHNLREDGLCHYQQPTKKPRYLVLAGQRSASLVAEYARERVKEAGAMVKRNTVLAIEVIVALSPDHGIDEVAFFREASIWFARRFGGEENLLSSTIHYDENCDHVHIVIQPLKDGRFHGSDMLGHGQKFKSHQIAFAQEVASKNNVRVQIPHSMTRQDLARASAVVLESLRQHEDAALNSVVFRSIQDSILRKPVPFMRDLGIDVSTFIARTHDRHRHQS